MAKQNIGPVPEREHRGIVSALDPESNIRKSRFTFSETRPNSVTELWESRPGYLGESRLSKGSLTQAWSPTAVGTQRLGGSGGRFSDGRLTSGTPGQSAVSPDAPNINRMTQGFDPKVNRSFADMLITDIPARMRAARVKMGQQDFEGARSLLKSVNDWTDANKNQLTEYVNNPSRRPMDTLAAGKSLELLSRSYMDAPDFQSLLDRSRKSMFSAVSSGLGDPALVRTGLQATASLGYTADDSRGTDSFWDFHDMRETPQ